MVMALKEEIMATTMTLSTKVEELEGELALCRVARMENYFCAKGIVDDTVKFYPEFTKEEVRVKLQGITQRGTVGVESVVKLGLGKDKLGSSKSKERGACEKDHKEDVVHINGNDDNCGNGKPRVRKNKPNRKRDKLKCFLCDSSYILKKCSNKSTLSKKEKSMGKALGLGSSARGVKAKEAKRDDRTDKELKKLGSSKGKAEAVVKGKATPKLGESSKGLPLKEEVSLSSNLKEKVAMKTVKLRPMRFNLSEASELVESSTRLPPMGEVGDALDFKSK
ncbi:hypothetical protein Godav_010961 [Gossypium davidsonii]|uniref:Uncharacterized protein n=1 Tax=Gossypium davidsonii TaxID=34287 RepID=A0A7J8R8E1_GOSDV|nr:hypothetical protein [Gossypium davidsonii]